MGSPNTYKRYPVEFSVSYIKEGEKTVEEIVVVLKDPSYAEYINKFTNFINSVKDNIIRFCRTEKNIPDQIYSRLTKFSSDDYQELFQAYTKNDADRYFLVLKNKGFKAIQYYISKVFFVDIIIQDLETGIAELKEKYPLVSNSHFLKVQSSKFKDQCIQSIVDDIDEELGTAANEVLSILQSQSPENGIYSNMLYTLLQTIAIGCSDGFLMTKFRENRQENANSILGAAQERKEKIEMDKQKTVHSKNAGTPPKTLQTIVPDVPTRRELSPKQENLLKQFEDRMHQRVTLDMNYLRRMLTKSSPVYIESLVKDMGGGYSDALLAEIISILQEFDVEIVTQKDEEIELIVQESITQKPKQELSKKEETPKSQTLLAIQNTPEKLTTEVLIKIFKELGYRFLDEKEFTSYTDKLGLDRPGKQSLRIKKKIIDTLRRPEEDVRVNRGNARSPNYQRIDLNNGVRLVKQKNTILRLCNHKIYEKLINKHFTQDKTDFDALMSNIRKEGDIDPRCV